MIINLRNAFTKFISEYADEYQIAWVDQKFKSPFGDLIRRDVPALLQNKVDSIIYNVKGSVGTGRWTAVPWIAIFDNRVTTSAQRGVYIVYLLNKDTKELFLTLNQGATDVAKSESTALVGQPIFSSHAKSKSGKTNENLRSRAEDIRTILNKQVKLSYGDINTGSKAYDAGCIYYKKYTLDNLGDDESLFADLNDFIEAYALYYKEFCSKDNPSEEPKESEKDLSTKNVIEQIKQYILSRGFSYDSNLLENFYLSLKTKPFVLLAGTSGTGKTRLVRLFSEAIGAYDDNRYLQVPVKPDWSDSTDLFGHTDLSGKFIPGAIVEFVKRAADDQGKLPYIICLDEMNLARVEYYLSDFLSVIETRDWNENHTSIITDRLIPKACYAGDREAEAKYGNLILPENLYVVGTVNMDETTFPFSKKVLDRANTIEFSYVDFKLPDSVESGDAEKLAVENSFLRADYLRLQKDCAEQWETVKKINTKIAEINETLKKADAHFGYRVRDEIIFYMLYREKAELLTVDEAFDNEIMQKILPRIQGSGETIVKLMEDLIDFCGNTYPKSKKKLEAMKERCGEYGQGYTSYWI